MLIKNANINGYSTLQNIEVLSGKIASISPSETSDSNNCIEGKVYDVEGAMVIPPYCEPHIHLDVAQTAGQPRWNKSGTLFEGIQCSIDRSDMVNKADLRNRAIKTLKWQAANGIQYVRTHTDVTDPSLLAVETLLEVKEEVKDFIDLQIVAFPQMGIHSNPNSIKNLSKALELGADVIGAIPHFEFTREYGVKSLHTMFAMAAKHDVLIDVHCDEIDDEQSRFLETLAVLALENGIGKKVTASHTTAMHSYNGAYTTKLFRLLAMSEINFVANPLVNVHLQGRFDNYPKRRGITRVKELLDEGINVCFGHDDVYDHFYPLGTTNMLDCLNMGLHLCHMMGFDDISSSLDLVTTNTAKALNIENEYGLNVGRDANFLVVEAEDPFDLIRRKVQHKYSFRKGKLISENTAPVYKIYSDEEEKVDFRT